MKVNSPRDEGSQGDDDPKWLQDFCNDNAKEYILNRCELLMQEGRYRDTEAIQMEFDF